MTIILQQYLIYIELPCIRAKYSELHYNRVLGYSETRLQRSNFQGPCNFAITEFYCIPTSVSLLPSKKFLEGIRASEPDTSSIEECVIASVTTSLYSIAMKSVTWDKVRIVTASDDNMNNLLHLIESGLPESRQEFPEQLCDYFQYREHLHTIDGVIIYKDRVVIPPSLHQDILSALHAAHQGVT